MFGETHTAREIQGVEDWVSGLSLGRWWWWYPLLPPFSFPSFLSPLKFSRREIEKNPPSFFFFPFSFSLPSCSRSKSVFFRVGKGRKRRGSLKPKPRFKRPYEDGMGGEESASKRFSFLLHSGCGDKEEELLCLCCTPVDRHKKETLEKVRNSTKQRKTNGKLNQKSNPSEVNLDTVSKYFRFISNFFAKPTPTGTPLQWLAARSSLSLFLSSLPSLQTWGRIEMTLFGGLIFFFRGRLGQRSLCYNIPVQ